MKKTKKEGRRKVNNLGKTLKIAVRKRPIYPNHSKKINRYAIKYIEAKVQDRFSRAEKYAKLIREECAKQNKPIPKEFIDN